MATEKRLIDPDELRHMIEILYQEHYVKSYDKTVHDIFNAVRRRINRCSTVDAVEVVRCKDCKYWNVHPINGKLTLGKCVKLSRVMANTWFCSYGERKDNE